MKEEKLKVVIICHFSNPQVREHLPLDSRWLYNIVRRLMRLPIKGKGYGDIAPWDTNIINGMKERDDVELHVISAHTGLKKMIVSFKEDNVDYHFVGCDQATFLKHVIPSPSLWLKINPMRSRVRKIVCQIDPDIVLLFGAENAYISSTILGIDNYPKLVMCQTIYNNPKRKDFSTVDKINAYTERKIFDDNKYFATMSDMHRDLLRTMKPDATIFHWEAPTPLPEVKKVKEKKYDFINFALSMSYLKGFHDSLKALAIVKREFPEVKLNLTGGCPSDVRKELDQLIEELDIKENVVFTPFFERQEDLFQHLQESRFAVLPCKMDYVAGTMVQCMHYGLPLVVYETSGTPTLNAEGECVLISKHGDVKDLAKNMLFLMNNPEEAELMAERANRFSERFTDRKKVVEEILTASRAVVEKEIKGKDIPQDILF